MFLIFNHVMNFVLSSLKSAGALFESPSLRFAVSLTGAHCSNCTTRAYFYRGGGSKKKLGGLGVYPRKILKNKCSEIASFL